MATIMLAKKEFTVRGYMVYSYEGDDTTQAYSATPFPQRPQFGQVVVENVPFRKTPSASGEILGVVRGLDIQCNKTDHYWQIYHTITFENEQYKDSTLVVVGKLPYGPEWKQMAVVGGTGEFAMAEGVVYGRQLQSIAVKTEIFELCIRAYCCPVPMPAFLPN